MIFGITILISYIWEMTASLLGGFFNQGCLAEKEIAV